MKSVLRYLAMLTLQGVNAVQSDTTPPERKLPEDGVEPDYDATPMKTKHTFSLPLAMRQQRSIRATARIVAAEPTPLTSEDIQVQAEMEEILRQLELSSNEPIEAM